MCRPQVTFITLGKRQEEVVYESSQILSNGAKHKASRPHEHKGKKATAPGFDIRLVYYHQNQSGCSSKYELLSRSNNKLVSPAWLLT